MADGGRTTIYSIEESTFGTTPASALDTAAYVSSISGGLEAGNVMTNALRSDYLKPKQHRTTDDGNISLNFELAYGDLFVTQWVEGVFRNDWTSALDNTASTISFDASGSTIDDSANGFSTSWANQWVEVSGTSSNDGFYFVTSAAPGSLTVSSTLGDAPLTTEGSGSSFTVKNDGALVNGSTLKSYTIEKYHSDLSSTPYVANTGLRPSGASLTVETSSLVNGSVSFQGKAPSNPNASSVGTGAANAASTDSLMNATSDVSMLTEGGSAVSVNVSGITLNFNSPVRPQHALTSTSPFGVGGNSFEFTGTLNVYWDDNAATIWQKLQDDTASSLYFRINDDDGQHLIFSFPAIKYRSGNPDVSGVDSDIFVPLEFYCELDSTTSIMAQIDRFAA